MAAFQNMVQTYQAGFFEGKYFGDTGTQPVLFEYIEEHYVNLLAKTLKRELGKEARLEYRIMVDSGNTRNKPVTMDVSGQGYKTFSEQ